MQTQVMCEDVLLAGMLKHEFPAHVFFSHEQCCCFELADTYAAAGSVQAERIALHVCFKAS